MNVAACEPLVIHCFVPVSRPSRGARPHRAGVGARARLGQRERAELLARRERRDTLSCSRAVGEQRQRARARVHGDRHADAGVGARELLEHEHVGEEVGAGAAVLLRARRRPSARARRARRTARAGSVCSRSHAAACGAIRSSAKRAREVADLALLVGQLVQAHRRRSARSAGARRDGGEPTEPSPPSAAATPARRRRAAAGRAARSAGPPSPPARATRAELGVGVDGDRVADGAQHRQVGLGVRVGPATRRGRCPRARRARGSPRALPSR